MNCHSFERALDALVGGRLEARRAAAAGRHAETCPACAELLELATLASKETSQPPPDLVDRVLARTGGFACEAAERLLCDYTDDRLDAAEGDLVARHLTLCSDCHALTGALSSLAVDLPRLARIEPDEAFVGDVMTATLPWRVRLGRWWRSAWPRWVVRPRFAAEAAYVATLILVLIFATPVSPLQAMPRRAVEIARSVPTPDLASRWERVEQEVDGALEAASGGWRRTHAAGARALERSRVVAGESLSRTTDQIRTFWGRLASLLESAGETPSPANTDSDEENS